MVASHPAGFERTPSPRQKNAVGSKRRATNVTLPENLLADARALEINLSQACERGLAAEIADKKAQRWLNENSPAIDAWNAYVEEQGVPLARYRQF